MRISGNVPGTLRETSLCKVFSFFFLIHIYVHPSSVIERRKEGRKEGGVPLLLFFASDRISILISRSKLVVDSRIVLG